MPKRTIHKIDLPTGGEVSLYLPDGYTPLSVGFQRGDLRLWVMVDPDRPTNRVELAIVVTGGRVPDGNWACIGRAETADQGYIVHVFIRYPHDRPEWSLG